MTTDLQSRVCSKIINNDKTDVSFHSCWRGVIIWRDGFLKMVRLCTVVIDEDRLSECREVLRSQAQPSNRCLYRF